MDLAKTAQSHRAAVQAMEVVVGRMVAEGHLGERETQVAILLMQGCSYQEIGHRLKVSLNTVRRHIRAVYGKLEAHTALELVNRHVIEGLLMGEGGGRVDSTRPMIVYP